MKKILLVGLVIVVIILPSFVNAQEETAPTAAQPLGQVWTPGYPLVPCGGFVNIESDTGAISVPQPECDFSRLLQLIDNVIIFFAIYMAVPIATIVFAFAGFTYITAGANPGKRASAHSMFTRTVIGLVIALASYLIVHTITSALFTDEVNEFLESNILDEE